MKREETREYIQRKLGESISNHKINQDKCRLLGPLTVFHELGFETCSLCLKEVLLSLKKDENRGWTICFDMF
jgi:hypothetical protein